ncbi:rho GTPase-activating protein 2-like [Miscanthus floridulus]|uniref:rho GTPase-activating protein 2-like n=1 Tax=Miscanthus floridulus TaxID=154761 RepID=UPI0034582D82
MAEVMMVPSSNGCGGGGAGGSEGKAEDGQQQGQGQGQGQVLALVLAALRKSVVLPCQMADADDPAGAAWGMEIGWPTDVRHVAHVTFDRLHGFLGLPVEFELEIPGQVPSASASVFGVSPESMQCGYDDKGNSVPKILLLMQERLYAQDGLKAEGIFRITPENSQEEHVREQLNSGIVPDDIDVHCLASLIKAWFRELPEGVLDRLSPEQVLHCNTEEQCIELVKLLPATQAALLHWVVELMADVVEEEESNKMNARNVAMVFAPNMTQMSDPLTALMHAVQVMNLLKTLILKTLREREDDDAGAYSSFSSSSSLSDELDEEDGHGQQDDENDSGSENYNCSANERPKDTDKAAALRVDNEQLIGVSRRHTSTNCHLPYVRFSNDNEDMSLDDVEECFLRRLEWKSVRESVDEGDSRNSPPSEKEVEWLSSSDYITEGSNTIGEERGRTSNATDVSINELRQTEIRTEMTSAEVRSAAKGELILCS